MSFIKKGFDSVTGKSAARDASQAQQQGSQQAIEEQRRQFDAYQKLANPYAQAGEQGLSGYQDLLGLNGQEAQQGAIGGIESSPFFQSQYRMAEDALRQNASATGGLRGGNFQNALADNRSNMLFQNVMQQQQALGGLAANGQNAIAGIGAAGQNMANQVGQGYQDIGQAKGGYNLAKGQINSGLLNFGLQAGARYLGGGF